MTVAAEPSRTKTNVSRSPRRPWGRLRARLAWLAAALGVLLGALVLASPASAQQGSFQHWISSGNDPYIDIGGTAATVTVEVQAKHPNPAGQSITVSASLSGLDGYATVDVVDGGACYRAGAGVAQCDGVLPNQTVQIQFTVAPAPEADLPDGETKTGELKINGNGQSSGEQKTSVTVAGNAGPESAAKITGIITSNTEPVADAKVVLTDGEGTDHETNTNDQGEFSFDGSEDTIAPGDMTLKVTKEDFEDIEESIHVGAGEEFNRNFTMTPVQAEPTESAEPTTPPAESSEPEPSEEPEEGGLSGTLIFLIVVGALLVVGGIIGIVFLLRGGKDKDDDDDESFKPDAPPEHQPTAAQVGSPGVYQAGPAPGQDAPTMVHNGPLVPGQGAPASAFGPAYGPGDDSTQVMPQAGAAGATQPYQSPTPPPP
ncbi:carboxypeptidase-like regulatory domain-containing protein, partial [Glycomyces tenuis]